MPAIALEERDAIRLYAALKDAMADVRGFDLVTSIGKRVRIPRTTNADVRLLLGRWTGELIRAGVMTGQKDAWTKIVTKWESASSEMLVQAKAGEPDAEFADNVRFWTTTAKLAIELASVKTLPSNWSFAVEALAEAVVEAPAVVLDVTEKVARTVAGAAGKVARGAGRIVGAAGAGFFESFGFAGIALLVGAAYVYTRKRR